MLETAIYLRVSTEEQAQEGYSIRAQEQKLKDYVRIKEWSLYKVYADEGISGKNITERPAINEMIEDVKNGYVKNVLIYKIDRLTRSTADLIQLIDLFNTYDCAFNSLTESIDTQSATGRMFIKIIGIFAEFERENIAERTRFGFERKAREGYSLCARTASYGYDRKIGQKIQTINDREAIIVREIYDMFINKQMPYLEIARCLNARKIKTKENSTWRAVAIKNILCNCNYIGYVRYATKDEKRHFETKGVHEPIISEELYAEAQKLIGNLSTKVYKKHPQESHYFSGILVCGNCGEKLVVHGDYKKDDDGNLIPGSYRCRNRYKKTCNASDVKQVKAEKAFIEYINNIEDFDALDEIELAMKEEIKTQNLELINDLHRQLNKLEAKAKEVLDLYISSKIDFDDYKDIKTAIEDERKQISSTLESVEGFVNEEVTIKKENIIKSLRENWEFLNNEEKRHFLVNFVEKIEIINEKEKDRRSGVVKVLDVQFS